MCLAIYKPKGIQIKKNYLRNGFDNNDDGAGFAVARDGRVETFKGYFSFGAFWKAYKAHENDACLIHFRQTTHGLTNGDNCHPFNVLGDRFAMIHNGVLDIKTVNKDKSDTWHFAELVLSPLLESNAPDSPAFKYVIETAIGAHNKIVLLRGDGLHVIYNEKSGHWHKGAWFSNDYYKPEKRFWNSLANFGRDYRLTGYTSAWPESRDKYTQSNSKTTRQWWNNAEKNESCFPDYVPACDRDLEARALELAERELQIEMLEAYEAHESATLGEIIDGDTMIK